MKIAGASTALATLYGAATIAVIVWPQIDLAIAGAVYTPGVGFRLAEFPPFAFLHLLASKGSWILAILLALAATIASLRKQSFLTIDRKGWIFLLLALIIGPGLIANVGLKDHWGRARPNQVTEFGGTERFSPALIPQPVKHTNGSFVAGDAAFGFFLPCFAYVANVSARRRRQLFWSGVAAGTGLGLMRVMMGGHFFSDVLFAGIFMLAATAALHAAIYTWSSTRQYWREWL